MFRSKAASIVIAVLVLLAVCGGSFAQDVDNFCFMGWECQTAEDWLTGYYAKAAADSGGVLLVQHDPVNHVYEYLGVGHQQVHNIPIFGGEYAVTLDVDSDAEVKAVLYPGSGCGWFRENPVGRVSRIINKTFFYGQASGSIYAHLLPWHSCEMFFDVITPERSPDAVTADEVWTLRLTQVQS